MKVYVVELYDELLEDSAIYGRAYLERDAAQRRADRMTYETGDVKYWAHVREVEIVGDKVAWLEAENERLRKKLEFEHENNASIRRLFDAVAPRCGRPDCPSLVEYVERLRELARDMHKALFGLNLDHCQACPREDACVFVHKSFDCEECAFERDMRELGIEVTS